MRYASCRLYGHRSSRARNEDVPFGGFSAAAHSDSYPIPRCRFCSWNCSVPAVRRGRRPDPPITSPSSCCTCSFHRAIVLERHVRILLLPPFLHVPPTRSFRSCVRRVKRRSARTHVRRCRALPPPNHLPQDIDREQTRTRTGFEPEVHPRLKGPVFPFGKGSTVPGRPRVRLKSRLLCPRFEGDFTKAKGRISGDASGVFHTATWHEGGRTVGWEAWPRLTLQLQANETWTHFERKNGRDPILHPKTPSSGRSDQASADAGGANASKPLRDVCFSSPTSEADLPCCRSRNSPLQRCRLENDPRPKNEPLPLRSTNVCPCVSFRSSDEQSRADCTRRRKRTTCQRNPVWRKRSFHRGTVEPQE